MKLTYIPELFMHAAGVQAEWEDAPAQPMQKDGDAWVCEAQKPAGEYLYRFVINGVCSVNDPACNTYAAGQDGKLWSLLILDESGQRLYDGNDYALTIEGYHLSGGEGQEDRKAFNVCDNEQARACFTFQGVSGCHAVTLLWYDPLDRLFDESEEILCADDPQERVDIWFSLSLRDAGSEYPYGLWRLRLLIDGAFVLEDAFSLSGVSMRPLLSLCV